MKHKGKKNPDDQNIELDGIRVETSLPIQTSPHIWVHLQRERK
jgi:hypothetical protein